MKIRKTKIYFNLHNSMRRVPDIGFITYYTLIPTIGIRFNSMWCTYEFAIAFNFLCFQIELKLSIPKRNLKKLKSSFNENFNNSLEDETLKNISIKDM